MSWMFSECRIPYLNLDFDTSNVEDMSHMFECCKAKYMNLSKFNTTKVETMEAMFRKCITPSLNLMSFNTRNVRYFISMFEECESKDVKFDLDVRGTVKALVAEDKIFRKSYIPFEFELSSNNRIIRIKSRRKAQT